MISPNSFYALSITFMYVYACKCVCLCVLCVCEHSCLFMTQYLHQLHWQYYQPPLPCWASLIWNEKRSLPLTHTHPHCTNTHRRDDCVGLGSASPSLRIPHIQTNRYIICEFFYQEKIKFFKFGIICQSIRTLLCLANKASASMLFLHRLILNPFLIYFQVIFYTFIPSKYQVKNDAINYSLTVEWCHYTSIWSLCLQQTRDPQLHFSLDSYFDVFSASATGIKRYLTLMQPVDREMQDSYTFTVL